MKKWLLERRWRIILSGVVIEVLPIVVLSSFVYFVLVGHVRDTVIEAEKNTTIEIASHIQDRIQDDIRSGMLIASRPLPHKAIKSADRKELTSRLKSFVDNVVTIERAFIANTKGVLIADFPEDPSVLNKDFSYRDWYKGASKSRQPYVSEFYLRLAEPKRYLFAIAIPIKTERREVVGILVLQPEADFIKNALSHMPVLKGQKVYLVDKKGNLIYHSDYAVDRIMDFSSVPVVQKVLRGEDGLETIKQDGVNTVTAYLPIKEYGWGVIVQRPEKEVLGHLRKINLELLLDGIMLVLILLPFLYRFVYSPLSKEITKRLKVQKELENANRELNEYVKNVVYNSEYQYRQLFDNHPCPMWVYDLETLSFITVNDAAVSHYGYSREEFLSMTIKDIRPPEDTPRLIDSIKRGTDGLNNDRVWRHIKKDGTVIFVEITTHIMEFKGRRSNVVMAIDITEQKKMEEFLVLSQREWENTFNTIDDMITVHDKDFNIIRANKAAEKILGLPFLEKTSDSKCFRYYHGTDGPPEGCPSCQCLTTGIPATFELFEPHLNMFIEIRAIPRFDIDNRLTGLIHVVRDITERKKTEEKLNKLLDDISKAKNEWEMTFDGATELMILVDKDLNIMRCNRSFADFVGVPLHDLLGQKCYKAFPFGTEQMRYYKNRIRSGKTTDSTEIKTKTGRWLNMSYRFIYDVNGEFLHTLTIATDITDIKNTQLRLTQSEEELQKRVSELEKFYDMAVGRELRMKEMKNEIFKLNAELSKLKGEEGSLR